MKKRRTDKGDSSRPQEKDEIPSIFEAAQFVMALHGAEPWEFVRYVLLAASARRTCAIAHSGKEWQLQPIEVAG